MRIAVSSPVARSSLESGIGRLGVELVWADDDELPALSAEVDGIVMLGSSYGPRMAEALGAQGNRCTWLQLLSTGYEQLLLYGVPPGIEVSNAGAAWSPIVAEHAMALLMAWVRRVPQLVASQAQGRWDESVRAGMGMLFGGRMTIVGMGRIGAELSTRARAFGMTVVGVTRSGKPHPAADEMFPVARLHEALAGADVVIVVVPLSDATRQLIDAAALAACSRSAVIVNIARGPVVDQAALVRALSLGAIAGAVLDVTDPEPLPADHPLWRMPNVIVSPHIGGAAPARYNERIADLVIANVGARLRGEPVSDRLDALGPAIADAAR
ncbi:Glyoxylate/hydroxypyruvate reductase B [Variovorax sp. SRS16]|uniref:D-2-hydroxyacid dehydrogenase n=1 Tax=Variovorax sp. SRS16 TaxID=282217 RepID=UPI0013180531|nr:D-2-hydroxyacid dehydrogenase [Variovorax sp. SRS16]VTU33714.1 Glyoxylate/hydroxypyruvate reductase B [Variovorax sp. SRS16]